MITSLLFSVVKLLIAIVAGIIGSVIGLLLLGVSLPTGNYYQFGRLCQYIGGLWKR